MIALLQKLRAARTLSELRHLEAKSHLSHRDLHKHDTCVAKLVAIGKPAVPGLVRSLADVPEDDPTASVPMILEKIGDAAVSDLARAMHDPDVHRRHNAILVLGRIASPAAVHELDDEGMDLVDREVVKRARHQARGHPEHLDHASA